MPAPGYRRINGKMVPVDSGSSGDSSTDVGSGPTASGGGTLADKALGDLTTVLDKASAWARGLDKALNESDSQLDAERKTRKDEWDNFVKGSQANADAAATPQAVKVDVHVTTSEDLVAKVANYEALTTWRSMNRAAGGG